MTTFERLIIVSEWLALKLFSREKMTLSALAEERARKQKKKTCLYSEFINLLFWYDPHHCRNAYVYYRYFRRSIHRRQKCPSTNTPHPKR